MTTQAQPSRIGNFSKWQARKEGGRRVGTGVLAHLEGGVFCAAGGLSGRPDSGPAAPFPPLSSQHL